MIIACVIVLGGILLFLYLLLQQNQKETTSTQEENKKFVHDVQQNLLKSKKTSTELVSLMETWLSTIQFSHKEIQQFATLMAQHIVGMQELINILVISLFANGHVLVEWVPGLAKTKTIHTFASLLWLDFARVQFTPDMLPSDLVGVEIFNNKEQTFETKLGPIVSNVLLADEINRTTPKVQSALLESMQEHQITLWGQTFKLPQPFFVLATQNPIEQEWTYALPEAQVDRFLCKALVSYPSLEQEQQMLSVLEQEKQLTTKDIVLTAKKIMTKRKAVENIQLSDEIKHYITLLVSETRSPLYSKYIRYGASPRGSIALMKMAKAAAYLQGRDSVIHKDVQMMILPTLRHRILLTYQAKVENKTADMILKEIAEKVS